jgi:hypothetical protein
MKGTLMYIVVNRTKIYIDPVEAGKGYYRFVDLDEQCENCGEPLADAAHVVSGTVECRCGHTYDIQD